MVHVNIVVVHSLSCVQLFATPWTTARQASLFLTISRSWLKLMSMSQWCHPATSSSVVPFSSHLQSFPASGSSPVSQLFTSGGQRIGASASASVLPMSMRLCCRNKWSWISVIASRVLFLSFFFFFLDFIVFVTVLLLFYVLILLATRRVGSSLPD